MYVSILVFLAGFSLGALMLYIVELQLCGDVCVKSPFGEY